MTHAKQDKTDCSKTEKVQIISEVLIKSKEATKTGTLGKHLNWPRQDIKQKRKATLKMPYYASTFSN